jgi:cobalamin biosynthesis Mg chelatase CobN
MKEVAALPTEEAATEFVRRALERGAPDNVTVIVARVLKQGAAGAIPSTISEDRSAPGSKPEQGSDDTLTSSAGSREGSGAAPSAATQSRSMIPWILGLLLLVAVAGGLVYYYAVAPASSSTQTTS